MENLWNFFEDLDEIVYVSDMDTFDLKYMNRRARETYNLDSMDAAAGKKCYELLQGCSRPCAMCTNHKLKPGKFYEWKYYNPLIQKTFVLKDTMLIQDNKRYRLELSIDVSAQEEQKRTIQEFTANESLVNEALRLALSANSPDESLEILLQYLGQALKGERIYVFEETKEHLFRNTYEWCARGVIPQKENLQAVPYDIVKLWLRSFRKNQNIIIKDLEDIRESDPSVYEYLLPQNIHSLVVGPLFSNKEIIGFYGVDNPPGEFLNHISIMFQVLGHFIVSILRRRNLVRRLESMSYYDQLTGAKNRHAMNNFIASVDHTASIGILYCDVMGLKKINDTKGHLEGDALLIRAHQCLQAQFSFESIFRIGGDEFLVMESGIPQEEMAQKVLEIRRIMPDHSVSMALGFVWRPQCAGQITTLLKEADSKMYEDKRQYYGDGCNDRRGQRPPAPTGETIYDNL